MSPQRRSKGFRMYTEHRCTLCGGYVKPCTKFEARTESPCLGKRGEPVLLSTSNSYDPENRVAWCWSCGKWVKCRRKSEREIREDFLNRRGVIIRKYQPPRKVTKRGCRGRKTALRLARAS